MASIQQRSDGPDPAALGNSGLIGALCLFQRKVAPIHRDSSGQHAKYASLQSVLMAITPAMCEFGLAITQTLDMGEDGRPLLQTTLHHVNGESIHSISPLIVADGRNPLHSWGGAMTYQRRYAILAILNLAAGIEDDDGDIASPRLPKPTSRATDDFI